MESDEARDEVVSTLRADHPGWWVMPTARCGALFS
jgi:hypothetical protein